MSTTLPDSIIPVNQDLISHVILITGEKPQREFKARFSYDDGSVREYDGRRWSLVSPSRSNLVATEMPEI
jgi:hypothetical protein